MADETPQKRVLPARERRESAAKRRASSPPKPLVTPSRIVPPQISSEPRQKRKYTKRASLVHVHTPSRQTSTPTSTTEEILPTRLTSTKPLPTSLQKQPESLSKHEYQSIAESATLLASLHRSRMQWLCDGIFKKYWTKPVKRKGVIEAPPNNPDAKSMQKLGNAIITIEPHSFEATLYVVKDPQGIPPPYYRQANQHTAKHAPLYPPQASFPSSTTSTTHPLPSVPAPAPATPVVKEEDPVKDEGSSKQEALPPPVPPTVSRPAPSISTPPVPPATTRLPTPPGGAKTTDPVIQMLAARAATDNHLKELMKVVATSRASPGQLREFQAHIDEFNAIVRRQEFEKERLGRNASVTSSPSLHRPPSQPPTPGGHSHTPARPSPLNPLTGPVTPHSTYPAAPPPPPPPRMEPVIKHVVIEFTSSASAQQVASSDRWLFPEHAVLDMRYGGMEMICSFLVERHGSDIISSFKDTATDAAQSSGVKWDADTEYYQPVTMVIKATQHRTIETIARSAKSLTEVQSYMKDVMEKKTRAPLEYLVHRLPRDRPDTSIPDFVDSAVELSAEEDDELKDFYGI